MDSQKTKVTKAAEESASDDLSPGKAVDQPAIDQQSMQWQAEEYIHHPKGYGWIVGLVIVTVLLASLAVWLQAWTFVLLVVLLGIAIGIYAYRPPRTISYVLSGAMLEIDSRPYPLKNFRAFGILSKGDFHTIMLLPAKRYMPPIHIYFSDNEGEQLVDILGALLPMEPLRHSTIDVLMDLLKF